MAQLLPVDSSAGVGDVAGAALPDAPDADQLRDWSQESYDLDVSIAASLGFAVGQLSGSFSRRVLVFESSRSTEVTGQGHTYRYGVALRVVVEAVDVKADGALTLPVVAAKVELEGARATSRLAVRGYRGDDLGPLLPEWTSFGVDQYASYMKRISELQAKIMSNGAAIDPELLATTATAATVDPLPVAESVTMVYTLDAIARGLTEDDAVRRLPDLDQSIVDIVRQIYRERVGSQERARPDHEQSEQAKADLGGLRLRHGLFI